MTHPDEGTLQALLDGEVAPPEHQALTRHLGGCERCRGELEELRLAFERSAGALALLDRPAPAGAHREFTRRRGRYAWGPALRRAAVLLLFAATGAAAAVPGSPLREWLSGRIGGAPESASAPAAAPAAQPAPAPEAPPAGVSVRPSEGVMRVALVRPSAGLRVRVRVSEEEMVRVSARGAAAGARFRTRTDRIEVVDGGPGDVWVEVPRSVRHFSLEVDGRVLLTKDGEQLRLPGPAADTTGPEIVFEVRP